MLALSDQITLFMVFLMLCFAGLLVMFYFVLRAVDELSKNIRVERSALAASLRDLEISVQRLEEYAMHVLPQTEQEKGKLEEEKRTGQEGAHSGYSGESLLPDSDDGASDASEYLSLTGKETGTASVASSVSSKAGLSLR